MDEAESFWASLQSSTDTPSSPPATDEAPPPALPPKLPPKKKAMPPSEAVVASAPPLPTKKKAAVPIITESRASVELDEPPPPPPPKGRSPSVPNLVIGKDGTVRSAAEAAKAEQAHQGKPKKAPSPRLSPRQYTLSAVTGKVAAVRDSFACADPVGRVAGDSSLAALSVDEPPAQPDASSSGERKVPLVTLVGDPGVGKTTLSRAFARRPFLEDYVPTTFELRHVERDGARVLTFLDTSASPRYATRLPVCYSSSALVIIVYNSQDAASWLRAREHWLRSVLASAPSVAVALIGTQAVGGRAALPRSRFDYASLAQIDLIEEVDCRDQVEVDAIWELLKVVLKRARR